MNKNEFLKTLKESLSGVLEKDALKEQLDYYEKYIDDEIKSGRTESEVLSELGDPRLIAKTIKTVSASDSVNESAKGSADNTRSNDSFSYGENKYRKTSNTGYGGSERKNSGSYMSVGGQNAMIGCIIVGLVIFIIVYGLLRFVGSIAFSGPIGFLLVIGLFYMLFGRGRR